MRSSFRHLQLGAEVHGILLWPLGGLAFVGHSGSPKDDIIVAVSGPATHIPQVRIGLNTASCVLQRGSVTQILCRRPQPSSKHKTIFSNRYCADTCTYTDALRASLRLMRFPLRVNICEWVYCASCFYVAPIGLHPHFHRNFPSC